MARDGNLAETVKLLDTVAEQDAPNQRALARKVGVSVGLVNALMHRAVRKGLVKIKEVPARRYAYFLTPKGLAEKSKLVAEYLDYSLTFFRVARQEYADIFSRCAASGRKEIVLCGSGELVEIATLGANDADIRFVAIFDRHTNQPKIAGVPVVRDLSQFNSDAVFVIADERAAQETYEMLAASVPLDHILYPNLLRISSRPSGAEG